MGDMTCDECGEQPYLGLVIDDESDADSKMWCECPTDRPIVFDGSSTFDAEQPEKWGRSGGRFVCYECGEIPVMRTSVSAGGTHPRTKYHLACRCEHTRVGFNWRDIHPDKWKEDMDPTKWESHRDEIKQVLEDEGPLTRDEIAERVDLDPAGVKCQVIHMQREHKLHTFKEDGERKFVTGSMLIDLEQDEEDDEDEYADPDETGLRSGKGPGWISKLLGVW